MGCNKLARAMVLAATLTLAGRAAAQDAPKEEPPEQVEGEEGGGEGGPCFPECRPGYVCHQGECVSKCNPPCPQGQRCTAEVECVPAGGQAAPQPQPQPQPGSQPPPSGGGGGPWGPSGQGRGGGASVGAPAPGGQWSGSGGGSVKGKNAPRFLFGFHLGAAGELEVDGSSDSLEMAPTPGAHLRFDFPVADFFALGPALFGGAWKPEIGGFDFDRAGYVDYDLFLRGRYPIEAGSTLIDVYGGLPIGYSLFIPSGDFDAGDVEHGWNIGVLFGAQIFFGTAGLMVDLGWMRHAIHSVRDTISFQQFVLNIGLAINFGG